MGAYLAIRFVETNEQRMSLLVSMNKLSVKVQWLGRLSSVSLKIFPKNLHGIQSFVTFRFAIVSHFNFTRLGFSLRQRLFSQYLSLACQLSL